MAGPIDPSRLKSILALWRDTGRRTVIPVVGGSMFPMLAPGTSLVVDHAERVHPFGAVIVFLDGSLLVAHRVVGRDTSGAYLTKGDALLHFDRRPVTPDCVVGRVVALRRDGVDQPLAGGLRSIAPPLLGAFSRLVGEINRAAHPLRAWQHAGGRLPAGIPGPTRVLRGLNRAVIGFAARRFLPRPPSSRRSYPSGRGSSTPNGGSDTPGGGS